MTGTLVPKPGAPTGIEVVAANPELIVVSLAVALVAAAVGWLATRR
jgi:hypothetical protein